jgi:hypothetical protein
LTARIDGQTYVIELKLAEGAAEVKDAAADGLRQIHERNYSGDDPDAILLSLAVHQSVRKIGAAFSNDMVKLQLFT